MPIFVIVILGGKFPNCSTSYSIQTPRKVVMIIRLHAMYQGSKKILAFLIAILLVLTITTGVLLAIAESYAQWGKL
jgi:hypothetical protein